MKNWEKLELKIIKCIYHLECRIENQEDLKLLNRFKDLYFTFLKSLEDQETIENSRK